MRQNACNERVAVFFMVILAVTVLCYSRSVLLASLLLTKICLRSYVPIWEEYSLGF